MNPVAFLMGLPCSLTWPNWHWSRPLTIKPPLIVNCPPAQPLTIKWDLIVNCGLRRRWLRIGDIHGFESQQIQNDGSLRTTTTARRPLGPKVLFRILLGIVHINTLRHFRHSNSSGFSLLEFGHDALPASNRMRHSSCRGTIQADRAALLAICRVSKVIEVFSSNVYPTHTGDLLRRDSLFRRVLGRQD